VVCCAFAAFIIAQCLALAETWRRRLAGLLRLGRPAPARPPVAAAAVRRLPWSKGLLAALVIEVGFAAGAAGGAWLAHGSAALVEPLVAFCGIGKAAGSPK
jgi:hypothetical protein